MRHIIGVDLGQSNDYTAISVIRSTGHIRDIIHLERLPLGMAYPDQVNRIKSLHDHIKQLSPLVVIDATGAGRPVVDLIKQNGLNPIALSITGGSEARRSGLVWSIPKRDLIRTLIKGFQNQDLKISRALPEANNFMKELMNFKQKINTRTGHDSYNGKAGCHDDLVLSAAMAVYVADNLQVDE